MKHPSLQLGAVQDHTGYGGGGIVPPPPLNSPITKIKLVNSPITNHSKLFHQPLSRVTKISCITIHYLKNVSPITRN